MNKNYTLSNQAVGAIMMAIQQSILAASLGRKDCDVSKMLLGFELEADLDGVLTVLNPPILDAESE